MTWATVMNVARGRWLLAGVVLVPLAGALLALLEREGRRAALAAVGEALLGLLGGREEATTEGSTFGPALRVATRSGRLRVTRRQVPWSQVVASSAGRGQDGGHHVTVEEFDGHLTFLSADDLAAAEALAAALEDQRRAALAVPARGERCCLCRAPLARERARCEGCGTLSHPDCVAHLGACPTLGCPTGPSATAGAPDEVELVARRAGSGERVASLTLVAVAGLCGALLTVPGPERLAGALLALLAWPLLWSARVELAEALLGARLGVGRAEGALRGELRLGGLRVTLEHVRLADVTAVDSDEDARGLRWVRLERAGREPLVVARGQSSLAARRAEDTLRRWVADAGRASGVEAACAPSGRGEVAARERTKAAP